MYLKRLELASFRNYEESSVEFFQGFNVLIGENAQGKTNLLEAINYCCSLRPLRDIDTVGLIMHSAENSRLAADFYLDDLDYRVVISILPKSKNVFLNGNRISRLSEFYGKFVSVSFGPDDIILFKSSPSERRKYLDRICASYDPFYIDVLRRYSRSLSQRNSLLKDFDNSRLEELDAFTEQLIESGAELVYLRSHISSLLFTEVKPACNAIFCSDYEMNFEPVLHYGSDILLEDQLQEEREKLISLLKDKFREKLKVTADRELYRGHTLCGPHRDDISAQLNGRPFTDTASQGQLRSLAIALKIAEMKILEEKTGFYPLFLLDDISSELDPRRTGYLFKYLAEIGAQVFLSTTDEKIINAIAGAQFAQFQIKSGAISPV
jgi:DNA replication and repair protein RecF